MSNDTMKANALRLLEAATATGGYGRAVGGLHWLLAEGTWGGTTLTLEMKLANGTAFALSGVLAANGRIPVSVPIGAEVRAVLTGGSPTGMYAYLVPAGDSPSSISIYDGNGANPVSTGFPSADAVALGTAAHIRAQTAPHLFNGTTWDRQVKANATARLLSAANTVNATLVKNAAGNIHKITGYNAAGALRYLKLYNKATAPTVGTDVPVWTEVLTATGKFSIDFGESPLYFATGIGFGLTTAGADADTGALTAGDITGMNIAYS